MVFLIGMIFGSLLTLFPTIIELLGYKLFKKYLFVKPVDKLEKSHENQVSYRFTNSKIRLLSYSKFINDSVFDSELHKTVFDDFEKFRELTPNHINNERSADFIEQSIIKYGSGSNYVIIACNIFAR